MSVVSGPLNMRLVVFVVTGLSAAVSVVSAQTNESPRCAVVCAPELKVEPNITFENVFGRARVEPLNAGTTGESSSLQPRESAFEMVLALGIPTEIPRVGITLETIFSPLGESDINPFTGVTRSDLNGAVFRDNGLEFELELNLDWLTARQTGGWIESHFDIVDKFSPAERPTDRSAYTHKLNFELDTAFLIFKWLPEGNWLKNVEVEGSLDYVATGLLQAGDIHDNVRYLQDASRWSFSLVAVLPIAPMFP
ncbi:MAG TPA: hypothetical protein EYO94_11940 [Acidobacteria bacterium]|nr:hypothetical protein [Acidobacteriota bacterium]